MSTLCEKESSKPAGRRPFDGDGLHGRSDFRAMPPLSNRYANMCAEAEGMRSLSHRKKSPNQSALSSDAQEWLDVELASLRERIEEEGRNVPDAFLRADAPRLRRRDRPRPTVRGARVGRATGIVGSLVSAAASYPRRAGRLPLRVAVAVVVVVGRGAAVVIAKRNEIALYTLVAGGSAALGVGVALLLNGR
jgi:hypothetical protein